MDTLVRTAVRAHRPTARLDDPTVCRCGLSMSATANARHRPAPVDLDRVDEAQAAHRARYGDRD